MDIDIYITAQSVENNIMENTHENTHIFKHTYIQQNISDLILYNKNILYLQSNEFKRSYVCLFKIKQYYHQTINLCKINIKIKNFIFLKLLSYHHGH